MNVVEMRVGPTVADIPGQLRRLADQIERGEYEATTVLTIVPKPGSYPDIFGWGEHLGDYGNIGLCELAKAFFVNNKVAR